MIGYSVKGATMTLDEKTTAAYEDKGVLGLETRGAVRADAHRLARRLGRPVQIHSGEWFSFEQINPDSE